MKQDSYEAWEAEEEEAARDEMKVFGLLGCMFLPTAVIAGSAMIFGSHHDKSCPEDQHDNYATQYEKHVEKDPDYMPRPRQMIDAMFKREGPKPGNYCTKAEQVGEDRE